MPVSAYTRSSWRTTDAFCCLMASLRRRRRVDVGAEDDADCGEQALAILVGDAREHAAIATDLLEQRGGLAQASEERVVARVFQGDCVSLLHGEKANAAAVELQPQSTTAACSAILHAAREAKRRDALSVCTAVDQLREALAPASRNASR